MIKEKFVYTPGPTDVKENVRLARAKVTTNPDIDLEFIDFYKNTCDKLANIMKTKNNVYILSGEGILGLEAACASLTEKGDRILVIDNGIFGRGFDEFVKMYGGEVVYFSTEYICDINVIKLQEFLKEDNNFKYATIVHCDTPTGVLNDLSKICPILKEYGIITVVDSVAAMVGEELKCDEWKIDVVLGASQKAISAPPGLTIVGVSDEVMDTIKKRKYPVIGFYTDLSIWENYYDEKWFPYTMPISDIYGLDEAVNNILNEGLEEIISRHREIAVAVREAVVTYGLELYLNKGYSNTVTAISIPKYIGALNLKNHLLEKYNFLISTSLGEYEDEVIRIGHMGENANADKVIYVLDMLDRGLKDLGFESNKNLLELFDEVYKQ